MADLWNASWRAAAGGLRPIVAATGEFRPSQSKLTKLLVPNLLGFQDFRHEPAEKSNERAPRALSICLALFRSSSSFVATAITVRPFNRDLQHRLM
jgi:hypothetical protein